MAEKRNYQDLHFIIIPPPFQGHINPSIHLSLKLAAKGFTITFVNTHSTHNQIIKSRKLDDIFTGARESGFDIRYATISDGFPLTFDRSLNREQFMEGRIHVFPAHVDELVGNLMGSDLPPTCLVVDTFSTWGSTIAKKYGLVYISLWTQPALVLSLFYHLDLLKENGHYGSNEGRNENKDNIDYVPGVGTIKPGDLISFLQETDTTKVMHRVIDKAFTDVKKADFIICNTVEELEPEPISVLKEKQPTYAIGPLFPSLFEQPIVEMNLWSESDCRQWLDSKPRGSVLYASFGSYAHINRKIIREIANGLMLSNVNFIWVLRPDIVSSEVTEFLPNGFRENVRNRGLVLPWCKQNAVLSHSAVGGFLTHCGWNSILESIWCGIPMICFPLIADQTTNRKLVVDDWKIGINLCEGELVCSNEVADKVKDFISGATSRDLRKGVEEIREKMENALLSNGSSHTNFDKFIEDVKGKIKKHKITS
ncbi:hypothetical protein RD792_005814 [Penstemon davidsonii]|uniref:Glycosyltransferase n=1 Tax=Penstemon davidsonii TaxID=160366 RepID=A0ABR0CNI4_9LAMI|nr:hypothetical protein RD792_014144 [Penstemon davidsonii]KAK4487540.1 hypothetical protein RD792_005814 [Penstemon davidsonii]